jgi:hypothetical protein
MKKIKVLYTGAFRFPQGDAAALRVYSIAKLFQKNQCDIEFAGWEQRNDDREYTFDGFHCQAQCELDKTNQNSVKRLLNFIFKGVNTVKWIYKNNRFDIIVLYNPPSFFAFSMFLFSKIYDVKIVLDTTEWYESSHLVGGKYGIASMENYIRMKLIYKFFKNKIVISSYLDRFYHSQNSIIVPPILVDEYHKIDNPIDGSINFIYAGQLGKKDLILPFIFMLPQIVAKIGLNIKFRIVGLSTTEVKKIIIENNKSWDVYSRYIECYGYVSREEVLELYKSSHFSILLRMNQRYALAGFPTKAVESWSQSCPIVTNNIGDLYLYTNKYNSIIIDENFHGLEENLIAIINNKYYNEMRSQAFGAFKSNFTINSRLHDFNKFYRGL